MTRTHKLTRFLPFALTAVTALLLAGCGGGGSSTSSSMNDTGGGAALSGGGGTSATTSTTPSVNDTGGAAALAGGGAISGSVVKGPVGGATVKAFALNGGVMGAQVASAMTDVNGAFTMPMAGYAGPVMLQMSGGTYTDEATGAATAMGASMMTAVLPTIPAGATVTGVAVTPLTAMAQAMAQRMAGGLTDANIAAANAAVGNYFAVGDIVHTQPMNPLMMGSAAGASQAMVNYGMTLAAISQYAKTVGMPSSSGMVAAMMDDAADGVLDGKAGDRPVVMGGGMMGGSMMRTDAARAGLASAMTDFMASPLNRSGASAGSMMGLALRLRDGTGDLHPVVPTR